MAVIAAVIAAVLMLGGGNQTADGTEADDAEVAQALDEIETACLDSGVPPELCRCAVETAPDHMSAGQIQTAAEVLARDGTGLTQELEAVFTTCRETLETLDPEVSSSNGFG